MSFKLSRIIPALLCLSFSGHAVSEDLVVYSGREEKFMQPLLEEFTRQTGVTIRAIYNNSSTLLNNLTLEGSQTKGDVYIGSDVGNLQRGSEFGLFRELPATVVNVVPQEHRSEVNEWTGLSGRLRVLVVNTNSDLGKNAKSVFDLADPRYAGRIGITSTDNESFIGGVTSYMSIVGKKRNREWLKGVKNNASGRFFEKHSQIVAAVAKGDLDVGLVNHYYALRHIKKNPDDPVRVVVPDQAPDQIGAAWNMAGIAISRHTKRVGEAEKLIAFLVSAPGQKIFAEVNQEYPVRPGIPLAAGVPKIDNVRVTRTPIEEIGRQREVTISEIQRLGLQ